MQMNKRALIKSDLYRYCGSTGFKAFCKMYLKMPGFRFSVWLRLSKGSGIGCKLAKIIQIHYRYKFGIDIRPETEIGPGLYIGHFGGIVVASTAHIGRNCNLSQCVTIGVAATTRKQGHPVIGDNVYIGSGAKIIGPVTIGNNCAIGANAVVTKDIPSHSTAVGIPAKVINQNGSDCSLLNTI